MKQFTITSSQKLFISLYVFLSTITIAKAEHISLRTHQVSQETDSSARNIFELSHENLQTTDKIKQCKISHDIINKAAILLEKARILSLKAENKVYINWSKEMYIWAARTHYDWKNAHLQNGCSLKSSTKSIGLNIQVFS